MSLIQISSKAERGGSWGLCSSSLSWQHLLHQAEGKSAPCGYQRGCTCAPCFACFLPWVYRKNKTPAKPLPHKIPWLQELLYLAGDALSQLQVQKSLPCFQLLHKQGWTHRGDSLSLQDNLLCISGRLLHICRSPLKSDEFLFNTLFFSI